MYWVRPRIEQTYCMKGNIMRDWLIKFCKHVNNAKIVCDSDKVFDVYHYTSPEAAKSILADGKIRLTDRYYLNDYSDGRYVLQLCLDNIDKLIENNTVLKNRFIEVLNKRKYCIQRDNFYVYQCSFSMKRDSLCMWNYYTKGNGIQGYCVHFSFDNTKDIGSQILIPEIAFEDEKQKIYSGKIIYNKERQLEIVKGLVDYFLDFQMSNNEDFVLEYLVDKIIQQGIFFKKDCFSVEEEYRLAIIQFIDNSGNFYAIKDKREFYVKNGMFVPYVDISFDGDKLTEIMISPTLEDKIVQQSIKMLCADKYKNLQITSSEIPVRY